MDSAKPKTRRTSIQRKLSALISLLAALVSVVFTLYFAREQRIHTQKRLEAKAVSYARLVSREVEPAVAFDDKVTAQEVFDAILLDEDVQGLGLFAQDGRVLHAAGDTVKKATTEPVGKSASLETTDDVLRASARVVSKEGPTGLVVLELSTAAMRAEQEAAFKKALLLGFAALVLGLIGAQIIGRSLTRRLQTLAAQTAELAQGKLALEVPRDPSTDELGDLSRSFGSMAGRLRELVSTIETSAATERERLDRLVAQRTSELDSRNRDMRLVLDHVRDGLFMVDRQGRVGEERSRAADAWFGEPAKNCTLADWVAPKDPSAAAWLAVSWESLWDDVLPWEVCLAQLPLAMTDGSRHYALAYTPVLEEGALRSLLVVVSDATSAVEQRRAEGAQRQALSAFGHVVKDRSGFEDFLSEAGRLVAEVCSGASDTNKLLRCLHTLKGNFGIFELDDLASRTHALETIVFETGGLPGPAELGPWLESFRSLERLGAELTAPLKGRVDVDEAEVERLARRASELGPKGIELATQLRALRGETAHQRLQRLGEQASALAERLGKRGLKVAIECDQTRLPAGPWAEVWSALVHVVRNAVDHGIEEPDARTLASKRAEGALSLSGRAERGAYVIEIRDDGQGIDWEAVRASAVAKGLPSSSQKDLTEALFADGLTTRAIVTDVSGRGVGLAAVREAILRHGGRVTIQSTKGLGTAWRLELPLPTFANDAARAA